MQLFKRFFESAPEKLSIPERILRVLTTKDNPRSMEGHEEKYGIFTKWIRHRVVAPVRVAVLLTLLGTLSHLPLSSGPQPSTVRPKAASSVTVTEKSEVPAAASSAPVVRETLYLQAGNPEADTVWDLVSTFLVKHNLPSDTASVTKIVRAFEKKYPDADPSTFQDGQEILMTLSNNEVSVELGN
jgi:hypothetical protein